MAHIAVVFLVLFLLEPNAMLSVFWHALRFGKHCHNIAHIVAVRT